MRPPLRRQDRVDRNQPAPGARLERGHARNRRRLITPGGVTKRVGNRRVGRKVKRMHHRRACRSRERDRGRIEGVIVDNVVRFPAHGVVDACEGPLGRA